ncbi:restriction endonuclease subunit S [Gordonia hankookensis]|uniref:Restriction endonuclease subunit S n=1 Tax=Gordonia hankookensis TaxID=589403 RepID=A0ABR7WD47_9ACTN|nr:restriction endonuclease subunit S [Gordonia hankookensis]MBD1320565.1 restriction endonuclease subunit S [Gordonia hankookensis]
MNGQTRTGGREATTAVIPGAGILSIGNPQTPAPDGYNWTPLSRVSRLESGHTPSRLHDEYWNDGIPWIGIKDATTYHGEIITSTFQKISQLGIENSSTRLLPEGTVCLSRTASVGYVVQMAVPMCTSQDFVNWVCGEELRPDYLRYALKAESDSIRRWATGSTHKTLYYPEAKAINLLMPSRGVQEAIVDVLGALDNKIRANRRMIRIIQELANATVERSLLNSRHMCRLAEIAVFHNRKRVPLSKNERLAKSGPVPYYGATGIVDWVDRPLFDEPLVLVGEDGTVSTDTGTAVVQYIWGPAWVNNHAHVLTGLGVSTELLRYLVAGTSVADRITGAVQPKLSMGNLKAVSVTCPAQSDLLDVESTIATLTAREVAAKEESSRLVATRDALLPLIMSGKITVKDAERHVEKDI